MISLIESGACGPAAAAVIFATAAAALRPSIGITVCVSAFTTDCGFAGAGRLRVPVLLWLCS